MQPAKPTTLDHYDLGFIYKKGNPFTFEDLFPVKNGKIHPPSMASANPIPDEFKNRLESVISSTNNLLYVTVTKDYLNQMKALSLLLDSKVTDATFVFGSESEPIFLMHRDVFKDLFYDLGEVVQTSYEVLRTSKPIY